MRSTKNSNGQTSVDFLIGVSLFAITLLFVLQVATSSSVSTSPDSPAGEAVAERGGHVIVENYDDRGKLNNLFSDNHSEIIDELGVNATGRHNASVSVFNLEEGKVRNSTGQVPQNYTGNIYGEDRLLRVNETVYKAEVNVWNEPRGGFGT
jgi:hypothetical protein